MDFKDLLGQWQHYATRDVDMVTIYHYRRDQIDNRPVIWHFVSQTELIITNQDGTQSAVFYAFNPTRLTLILVYPKQFLTANSETPYNEHYTAHLINSDTLLLFSDDLVLELKRL